MQFHRSQTAPAPTVIIVSLNRRSARGSDLSYGHDHIQKGAASAIKVTLPESKSAKAGADEIQNRSS